MTPCWGGAAQGQRLPLFFQSATQSSHEPYPPQQLQSYSQASHAGLSFQASQQAPPPASRQIGLCCPHFTTHRGGKKNYGGGKRKKASDCTDGRRWERHTLQRGPGSWLCASSSRSLGPGMELCPQCRRSTPLPPTLLIDADPPVWHHPKALPGSHLVSSPAEQASRVPWSGHVGTLPSGG